MTYEHSGARHGNPIALFLVIVVFLIFIVWMASSVAPGGATHVHTVPCDPTNAGPGFPSCPGNYTDTAFWSINGGVTDDFASFYNGFILLGAGALVIVALLAGLVIWMFRGKDHV